MLRILPPTLRSGTLDLPAIPRALYPLFATFLVPILAWAEQQIMRQVLAACHDDPLVELGLAYDPSAVVAACAGFHHAPGTPGRPPDFTIEQFVRAEIVRTWAENCSDRDLEFLLRTNLLVRWFVGFSLLDTQIPDHATLVRFNGWMRTNAPDSFFRDVLTFLQRVDPEHPTATPQLVDTFAMHTPAAATQSPALLLRDLTMRLVRVLQQHGPQALTTDLAALDLTAFTHPKPARTADQRHERLQTAVALVAQVVATVTPHLPSLDPSMRPSVQLLLDALAKVQRDELTTDAAGVVTELTTKPRGAHRLGSAVDLDATFRKHEGSPAVLGYNAVISTTATRVTVAVALTGSMPEGTVPAEVIRQLQAAGQPLPATLVMDAGGGWGKTRADVHALSDGQTQLVSPIPQGGGTDLNRFSVADFRVNHDRTACTCPNGVVSTNAYRHGSDAGVSFRFLASQCAGCALWDRCRDAKANPKGHRTAFMTDHHHHMREAQRMNASETGKKLLRSRWHVEAVIAWLTRYQGVRHARCIGQAAAQFELNQACALRNLLLWLSRRRRGRAQ
jgi:hypothetical protein